MIDEALRFDNNAAVTVTRKGTDYANFGHALGLGDSPKKRYVKFSIPSEAVTAAGAATVTFALETGATSALGTVLPGSVTVGKAALVVGYELSLPIPAGITEQYFGVSYTVATGPLTAGKFSAVVTNEPPAEVFIPRP